VVEGEVPEDADQKDGMVVAMGCASEQGHSAGGARGCGRVEFERWGVATKRVRCVCQGGVGEVGKS